MLKLLIYLLGFVFAFQITRQKGHKKLYWFFAGILFVPHSITLFHVPVSITFQRLMIYSLLFSTIREKDFSKSLVKMPVFASLVFLFCMSMLTGLFDSRIELFQKFYRPITYFFESFFPIALSYYHITKDEDVISVFKKCLVFLGIFGIYGIANYITKSNEYYNMLEDAFNISNYANANMDLLKDQRFRVSSFAFHAIYYGLLLALNILMSLYLYFNNIKRNKLLHFAILGLLLLNIVLVNSRTPLLALVGGFMMLFLFGMNLKYKIQTMVLGSVMLFGLVLSMSQFSEIITATLGIFKSNDTQVTGSSIDMRERQLKASYKLFKMSPVSGNGYNYITETLGYSSDPEQNMADDDLEGLESYAYRLLIEQGCAGILGNFVLFFSLGFYFFRGTFSRKTKHIAAMGLAMLITFLLFIFGTGDLGSFPFFMSIIGVALKGVVLARQDQPEEFELSS
jgi:hypothetical protein